MESSKIKLNPIWMKELRLGSRSIRLPLTVMFYDLALAIVTVIVIFAASVSSRTGKVDFEIYLYIFQIIGWIQWAIGLIIVPILTAGTIAGEREKQTLDLMLTTPKKPISIILGKLMAAISNYFIYIISSVPIMAIAFVLGGLNWFALLGYLVMMMIMAIYIGSVGVFCSAAFKRTIVAIVMTFVIGYGLLFVTISIFFAVCAMIAGYVEYYNYELAMTPSQMIDLNLGIFPLVMLFNPVPGCFDYMLRVMDVYSISELLQDANIFGTLMPTIANAWIPLNILGSFGVAWFFVWAASKVLNPARKAKKVKKVDSKLAAIASRGVYNESMIRNTGTQPQQPQPVQAGPAQTQPVQAGPQQPQPVQAGPVPADASQQAVAMEDNTQKLVGTPHS